MADDILDRDGRTECVVDHGDQPAGRDEGFREERVVPLVARPPVAAVDEDMDRGVLRLRQEQVERFAGIGPEGEVEFRSEDNTSELQSLMRNSSAVFILKQKKKLHIT